MTTQVEISIFNLPIMCHCVQDCDSGEWSWKDMLKFYNRDLDYGFDTANKLSDNDRTDLYATGGKWRVEQQRLRWDVLDTFREAAAEHGIEVEQHFNNSNRESCGYFQVNQNSGIRLSAYRAFLKPAIDARRSNLTVRTQAQLKQLVLDSADKTDIDPLSATDRHVAGLEYHDTSRGHAGHIVKVRARKEVILSGGSVGSPHALMLSGIGRVRLAPPLRSNM